MVENRWCYQSFALHNCVLSAYARLIHLEPGVMVQNGSDTGPYGIQSRMGRFVRHIAGDRNNTRLVDHAIHSADLSYEGRASSFPTRGRSRKAGYLMHAIPQVAIVPRDARSSAPVAACSRYGPPSSPSPLAAGPPAFVLYRDTLERRPAQIKQASYLPGERLYHHDCVASRLPEGRVGLVTIDGSNACSIVALAIAGSERRCER
jgi:hypothetical protein